MQSRAGVVPVSRSTARWRRIVFQAITQFVTKVSAPEVAMSSSARRPLPSIGTATPPDSLLINPS